MGPLNVSSLVLQNDKQCPNWTQPLENPLLLDKCCYFWFVKLGLSFLLTTVHSLWHTRIDVGDKGRRVHMKHKSAWAGLRQNTSWGARAVDIVANCWGNPTYFHAKAHPVPKKHYQWQCQASHRFQLSLCGQGAACTT